MDPLKIPIRASTQDHLEIEDIQDGIVIHKDGGCALVLATTAINYGLLSEREQEAIIYAYAGLINSLGFSIQIVIRSQKKDVSGYLKLLEKAEQKESRKKIREQIAKYKKFVKETVVKNEVLDKKFYLVIPMSALELGVAKALGSALKRQKGLPFTKEYILDKAKTNLYPKRDHLLKQLARLGLKARQMNTRELIQLYFEIYNPESKKQAVGRTVDYQTTFVQPGLKSASEKRDEEKPESSSDQFKEEKGAEAQTAPAVFEAESPEEKENLSSSDSDLLDEPSTASWSQSSPPLPQENLKDEAKPNQKTPFSEKKDNPQNEINNLVKQSTQK